MAALMAGLCLPACSVRPPEMQRTRPLSGMLHAIFPLPLFWRDHHA